MNKSVQLVEGASRALHFAGIYSSIDGGRFPVKRIVGQRIEEGADRYRDGHDVTAASLVSPHDGENECHRAPRPHCSDDCFAGADVGFETVEGAGMLTRAQTGGCDPTAIIFSRCETFLRAGDRAALLTDDLNEATAEGGLRSDLTHSQLFPLVVDRVQAHFGAWDEMVPQANAALQQTSDQRFVPIDDGNVITFVEQSAGRTNRVASAPSCDVHVFWLPLGDTLVLGGGERRRAGAVESVLTGERPAIDRGGIKLRIEPDRDPALLLFRCLA